MQANLGLLKVLVAKSKAEGLQSHLKSMVEGLLKWQDDTKTHFKAKVWFNKHVIITIFAFFFLMDNGCDFIH